MNFLQMESSVRITLDDNSPGDKLWSQAELLEYANDAENEACERANLIIDSTTNAITIIPITAGNSVYSISPLIIEIMRAKLDSGTEPLMKTTKRVLDLSITGWESKTGTPRSYIPSYETNKIRLYPEPIANDTLRLTVSRFPLNPMTKNDSPEIDSRYHSGLLLWMLKRAYEKNDSETLNIGKAKDYKDMFESFFGPKRILAD